MSMNGEKVSVSAWKILDSNGEAVFESATVTVALAVAASEVYGSDDWNAADPRNGPKALAAWVALAIAREKGLTLQEAQEAVVNMTMMEMTARLEVADAARI